MTGRARRPALACLLAATLVPAPSAMAQGLSPQVDRDSPAGIEYQLPLETAREQASGGAAGASGATDRPPLFGAGVTAAPQTPRTGARGGTEAARSPRRPPREPAVSPAAPPIVRAQAPAPAGALRDLTPVGAAGAAVLLVGVAAGLGWRRRAQRA
ncbi:MAG: hypothetical protein Q8K79_17930 [Solirubrobacteraceae bacterium]|nr:hypothetical protein [Solirubrobacteraceae bacterium]